MSVRLFIRNMKFLFYGTFAVLHCQSPLRRLYRKVLPKTGVNACGVEILLLFSDIGQNMPFIRRQARAPIPYYHTTVN